MKVRCDRNELAQCLSDVLGIVPATQAQVLKPIFRDFHLRTEETFLFVEATDLDVGARIRLDRVEVLAQGEVALPAVRFSSLVKEIPDNSVTLEALKDGRGAVVNASGYEFKLLGEDPGEFPEAPTFQNETACSVSREKLIEALRRVAIASCREASRFQLMGVYFEVEGDKLILTATDGKRLTNDQLRISNPQGIRATAIVPNRVIDVLLKVLADGEENVSMVVGDPNFQVSFGRGELTAKVIQGSFPDYRLALQQKISSRVTAKKSEFLAATRSAALMTDKETATVGYKFEAGKAFLTTKVSDIGESRIEVPVTLEGGPIEVRYNPMYLIDALRSVTEEEVRLEFSDSDKPSTVRGGQHYRHLVMPVVIAKTT